MKRNILIFVITFLLAFLFVGSSILYLNELQENKELKEELKSRNSSSSGGLEVEVEDPEPKEGYDLYFPIAESDYLYTSPYGTRISPISNTVKSHTGLDIAGVWKAQVVSVANGVVVESWPPPDGYFKGHLVYGGMVKIKHDNGMESLYAHLSSSYIKEGQRILAGEVIGRMGNTGQSDGEHLHFELWVDNERVNPLLYLNQEAEEK